MDSDEEKEREMEIESRDDRKKGFEYVVLRLSLGLVLPVLAFFFLSVFIGLIAIFATHFSITTPISVPSQCRILSSSVDLRSSKVCELGLLNYKAKHVFYPFDTSKFRCRYDYYWASVFEVEYKDHSVGQKRLTFAEAPNEALPLNCRPNFGAAWLTKDKFKVNKTYDCWYTAGISKVSLYRDGFFHCQAKDPSVLEMIKRYFILGVRYVALTLNPKELENITGEHCCGDGDMVKNGVFCEKEKMSHQVTENLEMAVVTVQPLGGANHKGLARKVYRIWWSLWSLGI